MNIIERLISDYPQGDVSPQDFIDHLSIGGKWFLLTELDVPEPWVCVKLRPEVGEQLREQHEGVRPAYHMNKRHWNDLTLSLLDDDFVKDQIKASYDLVVSKLPKKLGIR